VAGPALRLFTGKRGAEALQFFAQTDIKFTLKWARDRRIVLDRAFIALTEERIVRQAGATDGGLTPLATMSFAGRSPLALLFSRLTE